MKFANWIKYFEGSYWCVNANKFAKKLEEGGK